MSEEIGANGGNSQGEAERSPGDREHAQASERSHNGRKRTHTILRMYLT